MSIPTPNAPAQTKFHVSFRSKFLRQPASWSTDSSIFESVKSKPLRISCAGRKSAVKTKVSPSAGVSKGFGSKVAAKKPETKKDGAARLKIASRIYDKLYNQDLSRPYVISVRKKGELDADWLPVSVLVIQSDDESEIAVQKALTHCCREVSECARQYSIGFTNCLSSDLEYAYEVEKVFMDRPMVAKYLDETEEMWSKSHPLSEDDPKEDPYAVLGVSRSSTPAQVRTAYRSMAATHHPDRFPSEERWKAEEKFKKISVAYERIKQEIGGSELLGGTGTLAEDSLTPVNVHGYVDDTPPAGLKVGVCAVEYGITDLFVKNGKYQRRIDRAASYFVPESVY